MLGIAVRLLCLCAALVSPARLVAQEGAPLAVRAPILTIDPDRLFDESQRGKDMVAAIEAEQEALAAENRKIEEELRTEELALTEQRPTMDPVAFRALADDFDQRVQAIRQTQDAKGREIARRAEQQRLDFLASIRPVLGQVLVETGASMILDRRNVFISFDAIDVTELTLERIDAQQSAPSDN